MTKRKSKPKLPFPNREISDAFLQFAEPLFEVKGADPTRAELEQLLRLAWTVWNAVVFADVAGNEQLLSALRELIRSDAPLKHVIESLIDRKRKQFGDDHRLIGEYGLIDKNGELSLRATAHAPGTSSDPTEGMPARNAAAARPKKSKTKKAKAVACCGLCGNTKNLTKTECCGNWICDDEHAYQLFSYARNSCSRNHRRYTLCGFHFSEEHDGDWKDCPKCRDGCETEMYVYYGTNEHNFEVLTDPPSYEPTHCSDCGRVIVLGEGGYSTRGSSYWCDRCTAKTMGGSFF